MKIELQLKPSSYSCQVPKNGLILENEYEQNTVMNDLFLIGKTNKVSLISCW